MSFHQTKAILQNKIHINEFLYRSNKTQSILQLAKNIGIQEIATLCPRIHFVKGALKLRPGFLEREILQGVEEKGSALAFRFRKSVHPKNEISPWSESNSECVKSKPDWRKRPFSNYILFWWWHNGGWSDCVGIARLLYTGSVSLYLEYIYDQFRKWYSELFILSVVIHYIK